MIKIYADGADINQMRKIDSQVQGFTTNPTLMRKAGVTNYEAFAKEAIAAFPYKPISLEVFSDDFHEMAKQATIIQSWGENVYVKIPITNTHGESSAPLIEALTSEGIQVNVTAILTKQQIMQALFAIDKNTPSIISVFAGRVADSGRDPITICQFAVEAAKVCTNVEVLWASTRELFNIFQAEYCGCHIITVTPEIMGKMGMIGKDLGAISLDTVKMFYNDAKEAGYTIELL